MMQEELDKMLLEAARAGELLKVQNLIASGAQVDARGERGRQAIHWAAQEGRLGVVALLLAVGADIRAENHDGLQPLHYAAKSGGLEMVQFLVRRGARIDAETWNGRQPLHIAAGAGGNVSVACYLLSNGASIEAADHVGSRALHEAAWWERPGMVDCLLEAGADPSAARLDGQTPLAIARERMEKVVLESLREWILPASVEKRRMEASRAADFSGMTQDGLNEALREAAGKGDLLKVQGLIAAGAQVDGHDDGGSQALHYAAREGHLPVAEFLLRSGGRVDAANASGAQPLHWAAANGRLPVLEFFLLKGVQGDAADAGGWQALHYAAGRGQVEAAEFLLENGADLAARTQADKTPETLAKEHPEILSLLQKWSAPAFRERARQARAAAAAAETVRNIHAHWKNMARRLPKPGPRM